MDAALLCVCPIYQPNIAKLGCLIIYMLGKSDLEVFVKLIQRAESDTRAPPETHPDSTLRADRKTDGLLHKNDYNRLWRSLKIASAAGDVPESFHRLLDIIIRDMSSEDYCYLPLTHSEDWLDAIRWAKSQPASSVSDYLPYGGRDRQFLVGTACQRLRCQGYPVPIGAFGPQLAANTRTKIAQHIDCLIANIGGTSAVEQLCHFIAATRKVHDGMWLLGNIPANIDQLPEPAVPIGWLLSLALRHIHRKQATDDPQGAWERMIRLSVDFAATMDCQRYNQFDGISIDAPDFLPTLMESLKWRELFTLPQIPPLVVTTLRNAFSQIDWPKGTDALKEDVDRLFYELDILLANLSVDGLTAIPKSASCKDFPLLWQYSRPHKGTVNSDYLDPFEPHLRDHDRFVFFEADEDQVVVLPPSLTAAAACNAIYRLVIKKAGLPASDIVGDTIEKTVAIACRSHNNSVLEKVLYRAAKTDFEIDVAVRNDKEIVLFETKAKMLTAASRKGDMIAFIDDYTKSFMALFRQLVRHENNLKSGLTPLTQPEEDMDALQITKVAVSPLSYGPVSDHVLANALFGSIVRAHLSSVDGNVQHIEILNAFNRNVEQIMSDITSITPLKDDQNALFRYMLYVFWFDLGQLLYALHRGRSITDGLSVLRNLTFSTQDFWTEAAFADRRGITASKWRPLSDCKSST